MPYFQIPAAILVLIFMTACASIIDGTSQQIAIDSNPQAAQCSLTRENLVIGNVQTPGGLVVKKTKYDIQVRCAKDGYDDGTAFLKSGVEGSTWANIILGGGIGWAIDSAGGADNKYPEQVTVTLVPKLAATQPRPAAAPAVPETSASSIANLPKKWHSVGESAPGFPEPGSGPPINIASSVPLTLLDRRDDWMQFEYAARDGGNGSVWMHKSNVTAESLTTASP